VFNVEAAALVPRLGNPFISSLNASAVEQVNPLFLGFRFFRFSPLSPWFLRGAVLADNVASWLTTAHLA